MENSTFSVIIPAYNSEATIADTINSVIGQTYQQWELIIVNDGSTDGTVDVVECFLSNKVKLFNQKNSGVSSARNLGIDKATGKYLAFLDADDIWHIEKLEKQFKYFTDHPDTALLYTNNFIFKENINQYQINRYKEPFKVQTDYYRLLISDFIVTSSVCINTGRVKDRIYFSEKFVGTEDWDLWIRVAKNNKVAFLNEPLVYYREHERGISKNYDRQLYNDFLVRSEHVFTNNLIPEDIKRMSAWMLQKKRLFNAIRKRSKNRIIVEYFSLIMKFPLELESYIFPFRFVLRSFQSFLNR